MNWDRQQDESWYLLLPAWSSPLISDEQIQKSLMARMSGAKGVEWRGAWDGEPFRRITFTGDVE
jgi:hypothetical protein